MNVTLNKFTFGPVACKTPSPESRASRRRADRESPAGKKPIDDNSSTNCCFKLVIISKVLMDRKFSSANR